VSPLVVQAYGTPASDMVTQAAVFYARGTSPTVGGTDIQGMTGVGDAYDGAVGYGMGGYLQGRTFTGTGRAIGAEISAGNYSNANTCAVNTAGISRCIGAWVAARSSSAATPLDIAVAIGTGDGVGTWKQGITLSDNAIFTAPNTGTISFNDTSGSETSLYVQGTHTYALRTLAAAGKVGLGVSAPTARLVVGGNLSSSQWAGIGIAFRSEAATYTDTTSSGTVASNFVNVLQTPILAASSATTYTSTATLYIQGCPTAGTNVTITGCNALSVGSGVSFFGGSAFFNAGMSAASLDTSGTIAGSLCRTSAGVFVYKAGANCF
jgi:hypothetical protein